MGLGLSQIRGGGKEEKSTLYEGRSGLVSTVSCLFSFSYFYLPSGEYVWWHMGMVAEVYGIGSFIGFFKSI